jgi:hypothetical protein
MIQPSDKRFQCLFLLSRLPCPDGFASSNRLLGFGGFYLAGDDFYGIAVNPVFD